MSGCHFQSALGAEPYAHCPALQRGLAAFGRAARARIDSRGGDLRLASAGDASAAAIATAGRVATRVAVEPGPVTGADLLGDEPGPGATTWRRWSIGFADGSRDEVAVELSPDRPAEAMGVLPSIWPLVRGECLRSFSGADRDAADALLWTLCHRVGVAVLVLDAKGALRRSNAAGAELLADGRLLRQGPDGVTLGAGGESRAFRRALQECLRSADPAREVILVVPDPESGWRRPLSLSRFDGAAGPLAVLSVPRRPDPRRIERLAQDLGLTPAEARVASLMQLGLPNREAAFVAGLREQTFNTYAKRVLAKLDAGCRAEVAQRLTWQASLAVAS